MSIWRVIVLACALAAGALAVLWLWAAGYGKLHDQ